MMKHNYIGDMEEAYLNYLISIVGGENHSILLSKLFYQPFIWFIENDSARCDDGIKVRTQFALADENYNKTHIDMFGECNLLEVIIGLAYRMASMTAEIGQDEHMNLWFWEMLDNLGLELFTDDFYLDEGGDDVVDLIIDTLLERDYEQNGVGGLFPLRDDVYNDQTKIELWYQMSAYLNENEFNL